MFKAEHSLFEEKINRQKAELKHEEDARLLELFKSQFNIPIKQDV